MSAPPLDPPAYDAKQMPFDKLVHDKEISSQIASDLLRIVPTCKVVLLCDDSSSMQNTICEEGVDPFAPRTSTRWLQLKQLTAILVEYIVALCQEGLQVEFLNRQSPGMIKSVADLQPVFTQLPVGGTPLISRLNDIFNKTSVPTGKTLLVIAITDGAPTDGSHQDLYWTLRNKPRNVHVSMAECTDDEASMSYLDDWDTQIPNFDNCDDFRLESQRVRRMQGPNFRFTRIEYIAKILLATYDRRYFNLDQVPLSSSGGFINRMWNTTPSTIPAYNPSYNPSYMPSYRQDYTSGYNDSPACCVIQ